MPEQQLQQIKQLTIEISEAVEALQVDHCNELLQQRLTLLQSCYQQINAQHPTNEADKQAFIALLKWLEVTDKIPFELSMSLKSDYQKKLSLQKKTNFAIKQYNHFS